MYFKDIIGQEEIKKRLIKSAQMKIVPHAQLFSGGAGAGTFALALAYAQYLNCTNRSETDSCGECPSCKMFDQLAHPDLHFVFPIIKKEKKKTVCDDYLKEWREFLFQSHYPDYQNWLKEIDAGNSQLLIYSEESEEIIRKMSLRIYEAEYRILLVWLPEKMHATCANSLLKTIEEPPERTVILMISEAPEMILGTIYSRAQQIKIPFITNDKISEALIKEFGLTQDDAARVAHLSQGDWNKATEIISVSDESKEFLEYFKSFMRLSWKRDVKALKDLADKLAGLGRERQKSFLAYCQQLIRENFVYRFQSPDLNYMNIEETRFAVNFAPYVNERNVVELMDELANAENDIAQNVNSKMVFFDLFLHISVLIRR
jgi:DNA polymerase-3 subunit delta'